MNTPPSTYRFGLASQSLTFDCVDGVPSAVTSITVQDDTQADTGTVEAATTGSPAIESASTTLSAAAGPGQANPNLLTLTAVTSFAVNRRYWLTSAYGWRELVETVGKDSSAKYLYTRTALQNDYASGDTIASPRVSITLDTTWVSDASKLSGSRFSLRYPWMTATQLDYLAQLDPNPRWRAEIVLTVGGVANRYASFFDLIRYTISHGVTAQDVDRESRGWLYRLAAEDQGEADAVIAEAYRLVRLDLHAFDIAAYALTGRETLSEAVLRKAVALVHEQSAQHGGDVAMADRSQKSYRELLDQLLGAKARATMQVSSDGSAALAPNAPLFVR